MFKNVYHYWYLVGSDKKASFGTFQVRIISRLIPLVFITAFLKLAIDPNSGNTPEIVKCLIEVRPMNFFVGGLGALALVINLIMLFKGFATAAKKPASPEEIAKYWGK